MASHNEDMPLNNEKSDLNDAADVAERCLASVRQQGEVVRKLKKQSQGKALGANEKEALQKEIDTLMELKKQHTEANQRLEDSKPFYVKCRARLENMLKRRFFIAPAFEIYGGTGGLFDFGPPGSAVKQEVETFWRRHFVLHEDMLEISCTCLTPYKVLKTSGHVDKFCDLLVRDLVTGECLRADKLLEDVIDERLQATTSRLTPGAVTVLKQRRVAADGYTAEQMNAIFIEMNIKSPMGNALSPPYAFNLMFRTRIGPKEEDSSNAPVAKAEGEVAPPSAENKTAAPHQSTGFLRPETAQGIFVNFRRLLDYNAGKMPFAAAQLGLGFRNEIAPRNGLLRVREFQMAEIEHFCHPEQKNHKNFNSIAALQLPLFARERQLSDGKVTRDMTLRDAVSQRIINNETLAYFMGRTYLFLVGCGIQSRGLRFRQHLETEMAHYACDCWDAEIETSYGWVECVGHADRSAFDLSKHSEETGVDLNASYRLPTPQTVEVATMTPNKGLMGRTFQQKSAVILDTLEKKTIEQKMHIEAELKANGSYELCLCTGEKFLLKREMVKFEMGTKTVQEESYIPAVVEPSFGIGRIVYAVLEHTFRSRNIEGQEERCYLALPPAIAPTKCSLLPISANESFSQLVSTIKESLTRQGISCKVDDSSAPLGRRYARTDEIGIPFGITVDFQSLQDNTVTIRERDTMGQIRIPTKEVAEVMGELVAGRSTWSDCQIRFPAFVEQEVKC